MKDGAEYIRYMTERVAHYMDTPKAERKAQKKAAKAAKAPWLARWFGIAPMGVRLWWVRMRKKG